MKNKPILYSVLMVVVLCIGFFVVGPLIDNWLLSPMMPYLLIDKDMVPQAKADCTSCGNVPAIPIELLEVDATTGFVKLPVSKVPTEYKMYVHYPDNWNKWWNMYNPMNVFTVWLSRILFVLCLLGGIAVIVYGWVLYKNKRFKFQRKNEDDDD